MSSAQGTSTEITCEQRRCYDSAIVTDLDLWSACAGTHSYGGNANIKDKGLGG